MKNKTQEKLPKFLREYFWDVKFEDMSVDKSAAFVIKRVLDRGTTSHVNWVLDTYGTDAIKEVLLTTRDLSRPTGNFWADILGLDKKKLPCLQKPYSPIHFGLYS